MPAAGVDPSLGNRAVGRPKCIATTLFPKGLARVEGVDGALIVRKNKREIFT
jgi:hypothetical protein